MKQVKWFDRKFEFASVQNVFPSIIERLGGTTLRLRHKVDHIPKEHLTIKLDQKWSIQEHLGHLIDLEPLWQGRLEDIMTNKEDLRSADLENKKTDAADHNNKSIENLLEEFSNIRSSILSQLISLREDDVYKFALHPRLKTRMRIMDLFLFVAEHDDHHLASITEINRHLTDGS
jgi:uncharacterized damage-inducible protein DinB